MGVSDMLSLGGAVVGLFLPGYLLARALRIPAAWAAALPLSAVAICMAVVTLACLGMAITPVRVGAGLTALALAAGVGCWRLEAAVIAPPREESRSGRDPLLTILIGFCALICGLVAVRVTLEPLAGWDTPFRWEWLARCLLAERSLDFYPPRTAADFEIYPYPDGLPPLVSSVYWWLYAAVGRPLPAVTAIAVAGQFVSLLGLVHRGADLLWGGRAGWSAAALVAACPLVIWAVGIGQETGYTALSVAGQVACGVAAMRSGSGKAAFGCGLFAALGGLSRDYGPALSICGLLLLADPARSRRLLPAFVAGAAIALPWFLRNWWLTGNPVYSNPTPLGLPSNPVHAALMGTYGELNSVFAGNRGIFFVLGALPIEAGAVLVLGLAGAGVAGRAALPLVATATLTAGLWAWSTGFTAGGILYSIRVLAPTMVALALLAPAVQRCRWSPRSGARLARTARHMLAPVIGGLVAAVAIVAAAVLPVDITMLPQAGGVFATAGLAMRSWHDPLDGQGSTTALVRALEGSRIAGCRILTDDSYLAVVLLHTGSRFQPIMVWSPEVRFLFDNDGTALERGDAVPDREASARRDLAERRIFLALIPRDSQHWRVLGQMPFFRADEPTWRPAVSLDGDRLDAGIRVMPNVCRAAHSGS
jgi:hypothetical protein